MSITYREDRIRNLLETSHEELTKDEFVFFEQYVLDRQRYNRLMKMKKSQLSQQDTDFVKWMQKNKMYFDRDIQNLWRRLVDTIITKDPHWYEKCPNGTKEMDLVQKIMWSDLCLRTQMNPRLITIPKGTKFNHTSPCKFPHGRKYPYYLFNFYANGEQEFMPGGVTYLYEIKKDIPNVVSLIHDEEDVLPAEDKLAKLDEWLKEWDPNYVTNWEAAQETNDDLHLYDDYRQPAYICQVLGWNGIVLEYGITCLCGNGSKWMKFLDMRYNEPEPNVDECKDYSGTKLPRGSNSPPDPQMGQHYYEREDALKRRNEVVKRSDFYKSNPGGSYIDIEEANEEET
jgi:hypothetical protein